MDRSATIAAEVKRLVRSGINAEKIAPAIAESFPGLRDIALRGAAEASTPI
jgi:hypothetical protein